MLYQVILRCCNNFSGGAIPTHLVGCYIKFFSDIKPSFTVELHEVTHWCYTKFTSGDIPSSLTELYQFLQRFFTKLLPGSITKLSCRVIRGYFVVLYLVLQWCCTKFSGGVSQIFSAELYQFLQRYFIKLLRGFITKLFCSVIRRSFVVLYLVFQWCYTIFYGIVTPPFTLELFQFIQWCFTRLLYGFILSYLAVLYLVVLWYYT